MNKKYQTVKQCFAHSTFVPDRHWHICWITLRKQKICFHFMLYLDTDMAQAIHDDVIKWRQFPRYWPFVRGIHRSPVNSLHKGQWRGALMFFYLRLNKPLSKQWWGWWFETLSRPLWRRCNVTYFPWKRMVYLSYVITCLLALIATT